MCEAQTVDTRCKRIKCKNVLLERDLERDYKENIFKMSNTLLGILKHRDKKCKTTRLL